MGITERIYKKIEKHAVKICFVLAVLLALLITTGVYYRAEAAARGELQEHLAQEVLRFHVLANSDSDADQELKLEVRDAVLAYMDENMPEWARGTVQKLMDKGALKGNEKGELEPRQLIGKYLSYLTVKSESIVAHGAGEPFANI